MKQHITVEELKELSDESEKKLRIWCDDHNYFLDPDLYSGAPSGEKYFWEVREPLLSIGQMIEFLGDAWNIGKRKELMGDNSNYFRVSNIPNFTTDWYKELCDALWQAVKEVLEG